MKDFDRLQKRQEDGGEIKSSLTDRQRARLNSTGIEEIWREGILVSCLSVIDDRRRNCSVTHQEIASRLGVDRSAVSHWFSKAPILKSSISGKSLAALVTEPEFQNLVFPTGKERVMAGDRYAVTWIRVVVLEDSLCDRRLDEFELKFLICTYQNKTWQRAWDPANQKQHFELLISAFVEISDEVVDTWPDTVVEHSLNIDWLLKTTKAWGRAYTLYLWECENE